MSGPRFQMRVFPLGYTIVDTKNHDGQGPINVTNQVGKAMQPSWPKGVVYVRIKHIAADLVTYANREMDVDVTI